MNRSFGTAALCGVLLVLTSGATGAEAHAAPRPEKAQIIGGVSASPGAYPMMAFIEYDSGGDGFVCSGTVLSSNVVLTAGHCGEDTGTGVVNDPGGYTVITGNADRADTTARQISGVSQVIVNPGFDTSGLESDATLLVLSTPTTATPVQLATNPADLSLLNAGQPATLVGWGATMSGGFAVDQLQSTNTSVLSPGNCAIQETDLEGAYAPDAQLCVQNSPYDNNGACHGDSGGPLLATYEGTVIEFGIISFGAADCSTAYATFLTRADVISSWAASWVQAVALTPSTPAPDPTPTPTPAPTLTAAPAPSHRKPTPGTYNGSTSQGRPITIRVSASGRWVTAATFAFELRCRRGAPAFNYRALTGGASWALTTSAGLGFGRSFHGPTGERYRLTGLFASTGTATGTLTSTWNSGRYGSCFTGPLKWHAKLAYRPVGRVGLT